MSQKKDHHGLKQDRLELGFKGGWVGFRRNGMYFKKNTNDQCK